MQRSDLQPQAWNPPKKKAKGCDRYPKALGRCPDQLVKFAVVGNQIEKFRTRRLQLGQSETKATEDTIVYLSLLGNRVFHHGIAILRGRQLIESWAEIYYAGPLCVAIGNYGISPGQVVEMTSDDMHLYLSHCMLSPKCVEEHAQELAQARILGLTTSLVEELASEADRLYCALCMEKPAVDGKVVLWPHCDHWFCKPCITKWLEKPENDRCPVCCQASVV